MSIHGMSEYCFQRALRTLRTKNEYDIPKMPSEIIKYAEKFLMHSVIKVPRSFTISEFRNDKIL